MRFDFSGLHRWADTAITELGRDIYSLRSVWTHIYLLLYTALCIYGALKVPSAYPTIITVTGGVVSVLFTNYILSRKSGKAGNEVKSEKQ